MNFEFQWTVFLALIWRATWQAFVLAGIVFCLTSTLRYWISPKWRTLLWAIPLVRLALLLIPASGLSLFYFFDFEKQNPTPPAVLASSVVRETGLTPTPDSIQPDSRILKMETTREHSTSQTPVPLPQVSQTSVPISLSSLLTYLWLSGSCIVLFRWIGSRIMLSRIIINSERLRDAGLLKLIESEEKQNRLWFPVHCFVTNDPIGPSSYGFWRPTILLPRNLWSDFNESERQAIVNHELEHIRRRDVLLLLLSRIAIIIHWFNPLAYLLNNRMRREMELAVDAATVANFDEQSRHDYGELLIRLAQQTQGPVAALPMAGKRSALRARINQLTSPIQDSRTKSALAISLLLILFVTGLSDVAQTQEQSSPKTKQATVNPKSEAVQDNKKPSQYFITGTVRDAQTGKPVTDAEIRIFVASEPDIKKRELKGTTNKAGQYRIEVPLGNVQLWFPALKPGYWLMPEECMRALATTTEKPVVIHDIMAQTGAVWNIQAKGNLDDKHFRYLVTVNEVEDDAKRAAWLRGEPVSIQKALNSSMNYLDQKGRGKLTEVGTSGKFVIGVANKMLELIVEPGFDNAHVVLLKRLPDSDTTQMVDAAGKKATVTNATVTLNKGVPLLTCLYEALKPVGTQKLVGRVVDVDGNPLAGVRVGVAAGMKGGGSHAMELETQSLHHGNFSLELPVYGKQKPGDQHFSVILTKDGYAAMDSQTVDTSKGFDLIDFRILTLRPGYSLPIRVLDEQGNPLPGAVIEPGTAYALRRQAVRTDDNGRAVLKNLPSGVIQASVRWGSKMKWLNLVISQFKNENNEVTIRLKELTNSSTTRVEKRKPLAVGQVAPEWNITEWSDGRAHKLSDYRGRVVVLDFWRLRSSGCMTSIPAQKRLARKYGGQGVVFLGIHTPDGEMSQINKLKKSEQWTTPTALDRGTSILDGATCQSYGVQSYPTQIIIDANGKIAFRSDVEPPQDRTTYMRNLADTSGVKWPPAENATQDEKIEMMTQILYTMLSRELERVLKTEQ